MTIKLSGPFFDGTVEKAVADLIIEIKDSIGEQGVNDVLIVLGSVLQNPTGNYESKIQTERQQDDVSVNDSGIIYGPWLEGVGTRNATSRFKGYATFRKVTQTLEAKAANIAVTLLVKYLSKMT